MKKVIEERMEELGNILEKRQEQQGELSEQLEQVNNDIFACKVSLQELNNLLEGDAEGSE